MCDVGINFINFWYGKFVAAASSLLKMIGDEEINGICPN